jgi:superfamily II DNA or RNA helicase
MNLRKHQRELSQIIDEIITGAPVRRIIARVTPGGGKSMLPIIAGRLIPAGLADAICWICPRTALQNQGEHNFLDPNFREILCHNLIIRASTNEVDPCRGYNGFITTYQAAGVDHGKTILHEFGIRRYILVLDEFHHCEADGVWAKAIQPLVDRAVFVIMFSGTIERGDEKQIAFINYRYGNPDLRNSNDTRIISYGRTAALEERAIIPLKFHLHDGHATWENKHGITMTAKLSKAPRYDAGSAVYTAISTEYADELLGLCLEHWLQYRKRVPGAKLLVVTAQLKHAKAAVKYLKMRWASAEIATSHESAAAQAAIRRFKKPGLDVLVTIAMAYEGLDVPKSLT